MFSLIIPSYLEKELIQHTSDRSEIECIFESLCANAGALNPAGGGGGVTPIHYLYGYVPPNGVSISEVFCRTGYNISNTQKLQFYKQPFEIIQGQIAFKKLYGSMR